MQSIFLQSSPPVRQLVPSFRGLDRWRKSAEFGPGGPSGATLPEQRCRRSRSWHGLGQAASSSALPAGLPASSPPAEFLGGTFEVVSSAAEPMRHERQPVRVEAHLEDERGTSEADPGHQDSDTRQGRSRSRPRVAWNKGLRVPEHTRRKISLAQKRRHSEAPALRASVRSKLQGKEPWNKGKELSLETRARMSAAKLGRRHTRATRRQMSQSHAGLSHSLETRARLSEQLGGVPKSPEHTAAIAASQRRRHAAARILKAVESVHAAAAAPASAHLPLARTGGIGNGVLAGGTLGRGTGGKRAAERASRTVTRAALAALDAYKAELREYRALQGELAPWTSAFLNKHARKPRLADVEGTGIPWLVCRFKQYVMLRERLLTDTQGLRSRLGGVQLHPPSSPNTGAEHESGGRTVAPGHLNANTAVGGPPGGAASASARLAAALQYKRTRAVSAQPASAAASAAAVADTDTASSSAAAAKPHAVADAGEGVLELGLGQPASARGEAPGGVDAAGPDGWPMAATLSMAAPAASASAPAAGRMADLARRLPANAPTRVRSAMEAATEYRRQRAEAVARAAKAAAAAAAAPPATGGARRSWAGIGVRVLPTDGGPTAC